MGLLLTAILALSFVSTTIFKQQNQALAQSYVQTIKYRNLVIDLGNGVKTKAQLTYPAVGKGPFPAVLLIPGSGSVDMNETSAEAKRGVGEDGIIVDKNVWGNMTINDLIEDSKKALNVLLQQSAVDPERVSILGHSEGTIIVPRLKLPAQKTILKYFMI